MEIYLKDVIKKFDNEIVLNNITLEIKQGERILLYGKNGAGKTTILKILNLLEKPTSGEITYISSNIRYFYKNNSKRNIQLQRKMIFISQKPVIFSSSVMENLKMGLNIRKEVIQEEEIDRMLEIFELKGIENKYAFFLSSGQKRRVSLARGLLLNTDFILLDEPANNLDERGKNALKVVLDEKKIRGVSCIITTPDLKEWEDFYFDKIYKIEEGYLGEIEEHLKIHSIEKV